MRENTSTCTAGNISGNQREENTESDRIRFPSRNPEQEALDGFSSLSAAFIFSHKKTEISGWKFKKKILFCFVARIV